MTIDTVRTRYAAGVPALYDSLTSETVLPYSTVFFDEDFIGARIAAGSWPTTPVVGEPWVYKKQGSPTGVSAISAAGAGIVRLALAATSEAEEAALDFYDLLTFDVTKNIGFDCRVRMPVLPSATGVEAVFGLMSTGTTAPDANAYYIRFQLSGSGLVNVQTKDGVNTNSAASPLTFGTVDWHIFRVDCSNPSSIGFYIDGILVALASAFAFAATGANALLQPYIGVYKPSGTGVATMDVDMFKVWNNRV